MYETKVWHYTYSTLFLRFLLPSSSPLSVPLQEEFIRGALAQLEAERDEARRQLEEEHRLHMAARHQAAVALSLEHQHYSHKPAHDHHHEHDHTQGQHSHCEHSNEHSGGENYVVGLRLRTFVFLNEKPRLCFLLK